MNNICWRLFDFYLRRYIITNWQTMPNSLVIVFAGSRETSLTGESKSWFQGTGVKFVEQEKLGTYLKINRSIFSFKFRFENETLRNSCRVSNIRPSIHISKYLPLSILLQTLFSPSYNSLSLRVIASHIHHKLHLHTFFVLIPNLLILLSNHKTVAPVC